MLYLEDEGGDMRLYLVRHADARSEEEDPLRPLSARGEADISAVAGHLAKLGLRVGRICHSRKLRAKQTASVIAEALSGGYGAGSLVMEESDGLAPLDDPAIWYGRLSGVQEDIMLVGHLPHLAGLASQLLCGNPARECISFPSAGIACLERTGGGGWTIAWMITPATLSTCLTVDELGSAVYEGDAGI